MKPALQDVPYELTTERLIIRGPLPGDGAAIHEATVESAAELQPWMAWAQEIDDADEYEVKVREGQAKYLTREDLWLLLFDRADGSFVGASGLHRINWDIPSFEIGYWVRSSRGGQGYVTEAVAAIEALAFDLGARRVVIECDARNERSAAVARRLGYELEGTHRNAATDVDGNPADVLVFAKVDRTAH